jgi:hypothetical protein
VEANPVDGSALFSRWDHIDNYGPFVEEPKKRRSAAVRDHGAITACESRCLQSSSLATLAPEHVDAMEDAVQAADSDRMVDCTVSDV